MRLIMFGTGPFAVPTFKSLLDSSLDVLALVTRPISDSGKRRKTSENPTRDVAEEHGLDILDPADVNEAEFVARLVEMQADVFVVCDYGQILSRACLAAAKLAGINLHGSLLPKYRGAAPINWAIYNGDTTTGITIILMTTKLDGGPCLVKSETQIGPTETAEEIEPRLAELGVQPVHDSIEMLSNWDGESMLGEKQDRDLATKAPRLKKSDGQIDWSQSATQIFNQVRAFQPWPGSFTSWHSEKLKQPMRLILHRVSVFDNAAQNAVANSELTEASNSNDKVDRNDPDGSGTTNLSFADLQPGQVAVVNKTQLVIKTGDGLISIDEIQPAGKRAMPIPDFLRGKPPAVGDVFQ